MGRRWTALPGACLATVLLAGCSGGTEQVSTTLPTTTAPTAAASPTLPPLGPPDFPVPAEAREKSAAGVTAFTNYYVKLINHSAGSLDSSALRALSNQCETCTELADGYDSMKRAGQHFVGGELSVAGTGSAVIKGDVGETSFVLDESVTTVRDAAGVPVPGRDHQAGRYTGGVRLSWDQPRSTWLVTRFDADPL